MLPSRQHPWRVALSLLVVAAVAVGSGPSRAADEKPDAKQLAVESVSRAFAAADQNRDQRLSLDEFLLKRGEANAARRDFLLFDQDADAALNLAEFSTVPTVVAAEHRGAQPDPMTAVVDQVMSALDKSLDNWHENPKIEVDARGFLTAFSLRFQKFGIPLSEQEADPDGNQKVGRDEARRFLEIQFGVRRSDGKLLREPGGRVVNYMLYLHIDQNQNDKLERAEFIERSGGDASVAKEFDAANVNDDDSLSFDEWCRVPGRSWADPVGEFCQRDTNCDAFLSIKELSEGLSERPQAIAATDFRGFDLDHDGKLSLAEYRLTMTANRLLPWDMKPLDSNGDEKLSFGEFQFGSIHFPFLRLFYFHRLDADRSGTLESSEFPFRLKQPDEMFVMNADGTGWKKLFQFEGHPSLNCPAVSRDGKQLAFGADPAAGQAEQPAIYVMDLEGGTPRKIDSGWNPEWCDDGNRIACWRIQPTNGMYRMNLDGSDLTSLASDSWGGKASPNGRLLVIVDGKGLNVYECDSETTRVVVEAAPLSYTGFGLATWSPDGTRICVFGTKADGSQDIVTVPATGVPEIKIHHSFPKSTVRDFDWHPTEDRIVFTNLCPERERMQLYEFNPNKPDPPTLMKGQDETRNNTDISWTPDGKRLIIVSGDY